MCGDGVIIFPETCDDSVTPPHKANYKGCSDVCLIDEGFDCVGQPSDCTRMFFLQYFLKRIEIMIDKRMKNSIVDY